MYIDVGGIITALLIVWALIGILQSAAPPIEKLIWVLVVLALPIIGFLIWYFIGPGAKSIPGRRVT